MARGKTTKATTNEDTVTISRADLLKLIKAEVVKEVKKALAALEETAAKKAPAKKAPAKKAPVKTDDKVDYNKMKVPVLKELAEEREIKLPTKANKTDIIALLEQFDELNGNNVKELKEKAKAAGIKGFSSKKKAKLIAEIMSSDNDSDSESEDDSDGDSDSDSEDSIEVSDSESEDEDDDDEDLNKLNLNQLRAKAKEAGIKGYSKMKKPDLIAKLKGDDSDEE